MKLRLSLALAAVIAFTGCAGTGTTPGTPGTINPGPVVSAAVVLKVKKHPELRLKLNDAADVLDGLASGGGVNRQAVTRALSNVFADSAEEKAVVVLIAGYFPDVPVPLDSSVPRQIARDLASAIRLGLSLA